MMRLTGSRQEPFVYGSLGGSNFPLVPAPKVLFSAPIGPKSMEQRKVP
jgi:hypothetical protein